MADTEYNDDAALAILLDMADKLDSGQLELHVNRDGHIIVRKRITPNQESTFLGALVHAFFMYVIGLIFATYLLVQAMEAISFILSPNTGSMLKVAWIVFISVCGIGTAAMIMTMLNLGGDPGQPNLPRWMLDRLE